jgi:hypothetical protein
MFSSFVEDDIGTCTGITKTFVTRKPAFSLLLPHHTLLKEIREGGGLCSHIVLLPKFLTAKNKATTGLNKQLTPMPK